MVGVVVVGAHEDGQDDRRVESGERGGRSRPGCRCASTTPPRSKIAVSMVRATAAQSGGPGHGRASRSPSVHLEHALAAPPSGSAGSIGPRMGILDRILRAGEGKKLKALAGLVPDINALEPEMKALTDDALQAKTAEFRQRLENGEDLDDLLIEAFAVMREAASRVDRPAPLRRAADGRRGAPLRLGRRDEDRRGQDPRRRRCRPTSTASRGKGVHLVTVNDYLARRDAEWMGQIHRWLGLDGRPGHPRLPRAARPRSGQTTPATSPTARTTSSASTTCATTWPPRSPTRCSAATSTPSSTRSTRSSSTRPAPR